MTPADLEAPKLLMAPWVCVLSFSLLGAAFALQTPALARFAQRNTAERRYKTEYSDSDGSDVRERAIDAVRVRAIESLRRKGDTAAVDALRVDIRKSDTAAVDALRADKAEIVVKIDGVDVDVTSYAREHPGGAAVLRKFHGKDASKAFHAARHSQAALDRMRKMQPAAKAQPASRVGKLFTAEDRSQVHKLLGIWCLAHYTFRIHRGIWSADATGGLRGVGGVRTRRR